MKLTSLILLASAPLLAHAEEKLSVYFIGNSLTASTTLDRVHALFAERDIDLQFGSQLSGGKSLFRHLHYKDEPDQKWLSWETNVASGSTFEPDPNPYDANVGERFGRHDTALTQHHWDAVVMQPFLSSMNSTYAGANAFIDMALAHQASDTFYIYATWPRRSKDKATKQPINLDYPGEWQARYTATIEDTQWTAKNHAASRDFFEQLLGYLNEAHPDLKQPVRIIPAGDVLLAIDAKIKAGDLPGLDVLAKEKPSMLPGLDQDTSFADGVNILYADAVHLNPIPHKVETLGIFISGSTIFTVISGQNPVGMSAAAYGLDAPQYQELVRAVQQTIWDVVSRDPFTGVKQY
ncbi:hypothetical protein [Cerasicoccus fimbriatus]|uniref:hypothetical protein n=1 Tax=Cerasicoccus fimbriatus TaxID=3014554 RepID=UPI0022B3193E|nr:hypothetical protein [Cerasicoccus sp. TK19100]